MATDQTTAIVLRTIEFSETSLIVTLLTREFGRVSAIAKGARRPKSSFEGSLDLLAVCRVVLIRKTTDALDLLTEAKLIRRFRGAERSLERLYAGYYVAEMLRLLTDDHDPHPDVYDLAISTMSQIDGTGKVSVALLSFDAQALRMLGHAPTTAKCCDCGNEVPRDASLVFAPIGGGIVCNDCRGKQHRTISVKPDTIDQLERFQSPELQSPKPHHQQTIEPQTYAEMRAILSRYLQTIVGTMPKMQSFLPTKL